MEFINKLKFVFQENDIEILNFTNEKSPITYKCNCCEKIYNFKCARNLLSKITLCKDCYNPFSRWNKERLETFKLKRLFPTSELQIIEYKGMRKEGKIKCLKCGEIESVNNFEALFSARKETFCKNCEKEKNKIYQHLLEELDKGYIKLLQWNGVNESSEFQCCRCGHIFQKVVKMSFNGKQCPSCFKVWNKFNFEDGKELLLKKAGSDYELLQFTGTKEKSLVRHKCGFCYSVRIEDFEKTKGCPKCYKKYSSLEQKVAEFLDRNNYKYERQKRFNDLKRFSFDFEVQVHDTKILLEVQGQQHYQEIEAFDSFSKQQKRDEIKREYCLVHNIPLIEIPYWEINNLNEFLLLKFKDYLVKEQA